MPCNDTETSDALEMSDMGDSYVVGFIVAATGFECTVDRRVVLIGASYALIAQLLQYGYKVLHIDKDPAEVADKRAVLSSGHSEEEFQRLESAAIDIEEEDAGLRPDDIVCFVRSLHHMNTPAETLQMVCRRVESVIVCDISENLLAESDEITRESYEAVKARYADDADALEQIESSRLGDVEITKVCHEMLERHGFKDEEAIRDLLVRSSLDPEDPRYQFAYRLRCPCGQCPSVCMYWFFVAEGGTSHTP